MGKLFEALFGVFGDLIGVFSNRAMVEVIRRKGFLRTLLGGMLIVVVLALMTFILTWMAGGV
jgi:hypothetical protein